MSSGTSMAFQATLLVVAVVLAAFVALVRPSRRASSLSSGMLSLREVDDGSPPTRPHIVFFLVDDLGFGDVGYHKDEGSSDVSTPTIDRLARSGVVLSRYYSACTCTPARGALLTGVSAHRLGLQHGQIFPQEPWGLPNRFELLPSFLAADSTKPSEQYASHLVGKWHLGHYDARQLPTARGFSSFFGPVDGAQFYATHVDAMECALPREVLEAGLANHTAIERVVRDHGCYFDLRDDTEPVGDLIGHYSTTLFAAKAKQIVAAHDAARPLLLVVSFNAVHAPVWASSDDFERTHPGVLDGIHNGNRRRLVAALRLVDDAIDEVVTALDFAGLYDNAVVCFASDNGANPEHGGSNLPLRGSKGYLFEGGVRVPAFLHAPNLLPKGKVYDGLFHVADWLPTLVGGLAGRSRYRQQNDDSSRRALNASALAPSRRRRSSEAAELDALFGETEASFEGTNLWADLAAETSKGLRREVLLNIDYLDATLDYSSEPLGYDTAALVVDGWKCLVNSGELGWYHTPLGALEAVRLDVLDDQNRHLQVSTPHTYLFNLSADPFETTDLSATYPDVLDAMLARLLEHRAAMRPCEWRPELPAAADVFKKTGFVGPFWDGPNPPPVSQNCAQVGDDTLHRFRPPKETAGSSGSSSSRRPTPTKVSTKKRERFGYDW